MKVIKFNIDDEVGFNSLQQRIHNCLLSKNDIDGFKYSGDCYANFDKALTDGIDKALFIDDSSLGYNYILEELTLEEKSRIVDIDNNFGSPQTLV